MLKDRTAQSTALRRLLQPASVAVVGASPTHVWGRQALENFRRLAFPGEVAAINPKYEEIIGFPCYPSLRALPFVPDAVVVGVNRERAVEVVEEAADVGAAGAVVFAIGFAEAGPEGLALQERLVQTASHAGMAVIGPNCQGYINFCHPAALYMDSVHPYEPGRVALFSESGSVTAALLTNKRGVRWSQVISCGNEAVTDSADLLEYFVDDEHTTVICAFLETIRRPERFFAQAERAAASEKPVVVLKSGRTEEARRMATTHSGALAPSDRLVDELFRRHGILRVESMEEMLETAIALQGRRTRGNRAAVVTASGGQIELILDQTVPLDLPHPAFAPQTQAFLRELLPDFLAPVNPLDYWGIPDWEGAYPRILDALAADPNIDMVVGVADLTQYPTGNIGAGESYALASAAGAAANTDKVVALIATVDGTAAPDAVEEMLGKNVTYLSGIPVGFRALERLVAYSRFLSTGSQERPPLATVDTGILESLAGRPTSGPLALDLLAVMGLAVAPYALVDDETGAVEAAQRIGYPVVAKLGDSTSLHKTESGGVVLDLGDEEAVRRAYRRLKALGGESVLIQSQVPRGVEVLLGLQTDPVLGTFILVGLGGIWTEVLNDVAIRPVGLREGEAAAMLSELKGSRLIEGARGQAPVDQAAVIEAIERLDAFGRRLGPQLLSLDINPLVATSEGAVAVDAVVVPQQAHAAAPGS